MTRRTGKQLAREKELGLEQSLSTMRTFQINLNRCKAAHDLLEDTVGRMEVDPCLFSEPNIGIAASRRASGWVSDDPENTTAWWTGRNKRAVTSGQGTGVGYSRISIGNGADYLQLLFLTE